MTQKIEEAIMEILRWQRGHAISREALKDRLWLKGIEVGDRQMRITIENLRRTSDEGALICSSSKRPGYWLATTECELRESLLEERRRAISILVTLRERKERGRRSLAKVSQGLIF